MTAAESESPTTREQEFEALVQRMQGELLATSNKLAAITSERDNIRKAYRQLMEQFELLKGRIFIAKAERVDATQLELELEKTKKKLDALAQQLAGNAAMADATPGGDQSDAPGSRPSGKPPAKGKTPSKGRGNLADRDDLPQRRIEIRDADLEKDGGTFIGWELSYKLGYQRPEAVRVVLARAKYKTASADGWSKPLPDDATVVEQDSKRFTIVTAPLPLLLIRRGLLRPACSRTSSSKNFASACLSFGKRSSSKPTASSSTVARWHARPKTSELGIDPERYLAEVIRVMPYWPRARYLELAPAYWTQTRARLDPIELEAELGFVTVPPVLVDAAEQSSSS